MLIKPATLPSLPPAIKVEHELATIGKSHDFNVEALVMIERRLDIVSY